jgi:TonB family protein
VVRMGFLWRVWLAITALSCATPPPSPAVPPVVIEGYRWFAKRDCNAVRVRGRTLDGAQASVDRELYRLLEAYCLELEDDADAARDLYRAILDAVPRHAVGHEAAVRLLELNRAERRARLREVLKRRAEERGSHRASYEPSVTPLFRATPAYPLALREAAIEGWVLVNFEIDADGSVADPVILESDPPFVFDSVALSAVRDWIYEPPPSWVEPLRHSVRVQFQMDDRRDQAGF